MKDSGRMDTTCRKPKGRRNGESGQTLVEHSGMAIVVAVLIAAIIAAGLGTAGTDISKAIVCKIESAISQLGGGAPLNCGSGDDKADDRKPKGPCVVSENSREKSVSGTFFVTLEGGERLKVEQMSDGTYRITRTYKGDVSYEFTSPGISASGTWDDQSRDHSFGGKGGKGNKGGSSGKGSKKAGLDVEKNAAAEVGATGEYSTTYEVGSKEEMERMVDYFQNQITNDTTPVIGPVKGIYDYVTDSHGARTYKLPEPKSHTVEGGVRGGISGSANAGPASVGAKADLSGALGATFDADGSATYYYKANVSASADGTIQINPAAVSDVHGQANGTMETMIAVKVDANGKPLTTTMTALVNGEVKGEILNPLIGDDPGISKEGGQVVETQVDMTNPESAAKGYSLMLAAGIPVVGAAQMLAGHNPYQEFVEEAKANGQVTKRKVVTDDNTNLALDLSAKGDGFNFGVGYKDESKSVNYSDGEYWDGTKWVPWEGC
ncbi:hypothetical protein [Actinomyces timonensis]|uniref:hypothetical protein n=1 Tax=Actinomyces timonensis TaxID=1288391 RepID=UPI0012B61A45|nr:hypothetical protein [Actinomyces timonensis]